MSDLLQTCTIYLDRKKDVNRIDLTENNKIEHKKQNQYKMFRIDVNSHN